MRSGDHIRCIRTPVQINMLTHGQPQGKTSNGFTRGFTTPWLFISSPWDFSTPIHNPTATRGGTTGNAWLTTPRNSLHRECVQIMEAKTLAFELSAEVLENFGCLYDRMWSSPRGDPFHFCLAANSWYTGWKVKVSFEN